MLKLLTNADQQYDQFLHGAVAAGACVLTAIQTYDHDGALPGIVGMVGTTIFGVLALYYILVGAQMMYMADVEESPSGERLRNLLSSAGLITTFGALGHEIVVLGGAPDLVKPAIVAALVCLLRTLDPTLDKLANKDRGFVSSVTIRCSGDDEDKPALSFLSPRAIFLHVLIGGSFLLVFLHDASIKDSDYSSKISSSTTDIYWALYVLIGAHVGLYPLFGLVSYCGNMMGAYPYKETDACNEGEVFSPNRIPLLRQVVGTSILALSAYLVGAFYPLHRVELLIGATALYAIADSFGRNYL
jgi:hypothetical protein